MRNLTIVQAQRYMRQARIQISGASGSGKTYTGLVAATEALKYADKFGVGDKIFVIDTEENSSTLYAGSDMFSFYQANWHKPYKLDELAEYLEYMTAEGVKKEGVGVFMLDSMSHWWHAEGGALEEVNTVQKRPGFDSFRAWSVVTPKIDRVIQGIISLPCPVIVTLREAHEYERSTDNRGKTVIERVGGKARWRDDSLYEFDVGLKMSRGAIAHVEKTRYAPWNDLSITRPDGKFFAQYYDWLVDAESKGVELVYAYRDGSAVAPNAAARRLFSEYHIENGEVPKDAETLKEWHQSR